MKRPGPHEELTDPENERVLGTLTQRAWAKLNAKSIKARFYAPENYDLGQIDEMDLSNLLYHNALQTSGSIQGQHRADLTRAIVGSPAQTVGVSVPTADPTKQETDAPRKRGL